MGGTFSLQSSESESLLVPAGLRSEGLYRVSGFTDSVEEVKLAFDKGWCSVAPAHGNV